MKYIFSLQPSNENFGDDSANFSDESDSISEESPYSINYIDVENLLTINAIDDDEPESQMTTISTEQYIHLMQLIPQVEKLKDTINQMALKIKSKDSKLKELQRIYKDGKWVNLSKLSNVSIFYPVNHR